MFSDQIIYYILSSLIYSLYEKYISRDYVNDIVKIKVQISIGKESLLSLQYDFS